MIELTDCLKCKGAPLYHACDHCDFCGTSDNEPIEGGKDDERYMSARLDLEDRDVPSLNDTITKEVK